MHCEHPPVHVVCILETTPPTHTHTFSFFLIHMSHPKPASHLATCHTTLHWDFRQLRKNKHSLNDQRDVKAILSRACSLRGPQKNYPETRQTQQHSQAIRRPAQGASHPLQHAAPNNRNISGDGVALQSVSRGGGEAERLRFPLRGMRGWGPAPWLFPSLVSSEITANPSPVPLLHIVLVHRGLANKPERLSFSNLRLQVILSIPLIAFINTPAGLRGASTSLCYWVSPGCRLAFPHRDSHSWLPSTSWELCPAPPEHPPSASPTPRSQARSSAVTRMLIQQRALHRAC